MKTYVNRIKGKDYLYAWDTLFIAKGKSFKKVRSLGPIDSSIDVAAKKKEFSDYLNREESRLRTEYWGKCLHHDGFRRYVRLDKIENLRSELFRSKNNMGPIATTAMEAAFLVDFIYNSNKIEGSKIPKESVEAIVRGGSKGKNEEVSNTIRAIYFLDHDFSFTLNKIQKLHAILLAHEPAKLGYRKERVIVGNSEVVDWKIVLSELKKLLDWYQKANQSWYPLELTFTFHYRFERIHPFVDGNGRLGRLLMNKILKDHKYHPIIVWNKRRQSYVASFAKYMEGRGEYYFKFMCDQFVKTHEIYIEKIGNAFDLDKQMEYFLRPSGYNIS